MPATVMPNYASGTQHGVSYIQEVTFGICPCTPAMKALRQTGCSLTASKDPLRSNEMRSDRMVPDVRLGADKAAGDIPFEMIYKEYDSWIEAALFGFFTANVAKAGVTPISMTVERRYTDVGVYELFKGVMVNTFSLSLRPNAIVTGSFNVVGAGFAAPAGTSVDASPDATTPAYSPYDTFTGTLKEGGSTIANVTGLEFTLNNGLTPAYVVGSKSAPTIIPGQSNLSGTLSCYFSSVAMKNKFLNETESSIEVVLGNGTEQSYTILIPRVKYLGSASPVQGEGPIVLNMPFQALRDNTEASNIKITRTAT